jgi:hypothetical protein
MRRRDFITRQVHGDAPRSAPAGAFQLKGEIFQLLGGRSNTTALSNLRSVSQEFAGLRGNTRRVFVPGADATELKHSPQ